MAAFSDESSGLAKALRSATSSEQFDLGGHAPAAAEALIARAFSAPLELDEMVRLSLVVGAGKGGRQKYDEKLPRAVAKALGELGFAEDNGASCELVTLSLVASH